MNISIKDLKEVLSQHKRWLRGERGACANLSGADLSGSRMAGANLAHAILSGADLTGAILVRANLSGVDLYGADLAGADLSRANFYRAALVEADLTDARLVRFKTWDRFELPLPFSRVQIAYGEPVRVPRVLNADALARLQVEMAEKLQALNAAARAALESRRRV